MIEDLKKKAEELVINVYQLAVASNSIEDVDLEEVEPELATELIAVESKIDDLLIEVDELQIELSSQTDKTEFIRKLNKFIDDTDALDSHILAMPRPKNRIGRPKFYERIRVLNSRITQINEKIVMIKLNIPSPVNDQILPDGQPV